MITEIAILVAGAAAGAGVTALLVNRAHNARLSLYLDQAKAKAATIEHEAEKILHDAKIRAKDLEIEAKNAYEAKKQKLLSDYEERFEKLEQKERDVNDLFKDELKNIMLEKEELKKEKGAL